MKRSIFYIVSILIFLISCQEKGKNTTAVNTTPRITPMPLSLLEKQGSFTIDKETSLFIKKDETKAIALFFADIIHEKTGLRLKTSDQKKENSIHLLIDNSLELNEEGYLLKTFENHISITSKTTKGLFYGAQSLMQLLPLISNDSFKEDLQVVIPSVDIKDEPAFTWRGVLLDVSRHFFTVEFIKKQLDFLATLKINKFHWHLTDDQGWRIEIKQYPKLTEIGAKRGDTESDVYHGFYTQEEVKEVVAYAKERFIDVVPEFDVPGHARAILASYPEFACVEKPFEIREIWGVDYDILCAGKEDVYVFVENVIQEMAVLFPYKYFHVGGDEVPKRSWKESELCQKLMKREGLKDEQELQSYFMARVEKILHNHNKIMIGWDEILEGGITETTNIMSWQGEKGGIKAANEGHDVIMTPLDYVYLNFYQGSKQVEPMAFGGHTPLQKTYHYNPIPNAIKEDKRHHILGLQGNLWAEQTDNDKIAEYQLYPRLIAVAETGWSIESNKNFNSFLNRLNSIYPILDHHNINYHIPLPEGPSSDHIAFLDSVTLPFYTTHPVKMVYTTDGSEPTNNSKEYSTALTFNTTTTLKIASVLPHGKISKTRTINIAKESYLPSISESMDLSPGLKIKTIKGHFLSIDEIQTKTPTEVAVVQNIKEANHTFDWGHEVKKENFKAVFLEGYIDIPEDGIYYFSSTQDQIWIGDKLVIDYKKTIKKHPEESSIALKKGKHKLKIIYLNNVVKGWASDWNTVELKYRKEFDKEYKIVNETMIFHQNSNDALSLK
ncbi:family 20 glycosylhydrolase [uncultured Aquimarina sp.]|uniref:family 20 glycosylhydrolase n=1 Tax=uncultured Aquimarina sp. TaxID=575652 RepID=UPI00262A2E62|nr:family 20 glycosylhydrolase [uncultured Aquimarina sp.]